MPSTIFISYSTVDLAAATRARDALHAVGHTAYVAQYDARGGVRLPQDIKEHIASSDIFVVIWSTNAKNSDWVTQEIGIAESLGKLIIPFVLDRDLKPGGFISDRKYVTAAENLDAAILELRAIVDHETSKKGTKARFVIGALILAAILSK